MIYRMVTRYNASSLHIKIYTLKSASESPAVDMLTTNDDRIIDWVEFISYRPHSVGYVRRPYYGHGTGCLWLLTSNLKRRDNM